jgi:hypothetical protein
MSPGQDNGSFNSEQMIDQRRDFVDKRFVLIWVLSSLIMGGVALLLDCSEIWVGKPEWGTEDFHLSIEVFLLGWTIISLVLGTIQYLLLRKYCSSSGWWILTYLIGTLLIGLLLQSLADPVIRFLVPREFWNKWIPNGRNIVWSLITGLSNSTGICFLQWLVVRRHLGRVVHWFGVCLLSGIISALLIATEVDYYGLGTLVAAQGTLSGLVIYRALYY